MFSCVEFKKKKIPKVVDPDVAIKKMFFLQSCVKTKLGTFAFQANENGKFQKLNVRVRIFYDYFGTVNFFQT